MLGCIIPSPPVELKIRRHSEPKIVRRYSPIERLLSTRFSSQCGTTRRTESGGQVPFGDRGIGFDSSTKEIDAAEGSDGVASV